MLHKIRISLFLLLVLAGIGGPLIAKEAPKRITWWDLVSDKEFDYYQREAQRYNEDPEYRGGEKPPPVKVNPRVNNLYVTIPGYIVAVDNQKGVFEKVDSFLFVPFQGACIHVPPPPENQTIFVTLNKAVKSDPYMPVLLTGTLHIDEGANDLANYSYSMKGESIKPYTD